MASAKGAGPDFYLVSPEQMQYSRTSISQEFVAPGGLGGVDEVIAAVAKTDSLQAVLTFTPEPAEGSSMLADQSSQFDDDQSVLPVEEVSWFGEFEETRNFLLSVA